MESWQKEHIIHNLNALIEYTHLNACVLAVLCAKRILETKDIWDLVSLLIVNDSIAYTINDISFNVHQCNA